MLWCASAQQPQPGCNDCDSHLLRLKTSAVERTIQRHGKQLLRSGDLPLLAEL
jgi:hypothetical protein